MTYELIEQERLRDVATWLAAWDWPLSEVDSVRRAELFGWTVVDDDPGKGQLFDTGMLTERSFASSSVARGNLFELSIFTLPVVGPISADGQEYVTDVYADQVQIVTDVLGKPAKTKPGVNGSTTWLLPSGAVLVVGRTDSSCSWDLDSPDFSQLQRDLGRRS